MLDRGDLEEYDEYSMDKKLLEIKNSYLIPIFIEIKKIIKMIKKTEFSVLEKEFSVTV